MILRVESCNGSIVVQSMAFAYFGLEEGVDNSGVPTMVVSLNSTATLQMYNPSKFFGYHVKASPMGLKYLDLSIAEGQVMLLDASTASP